MSGFGDFRVQGGACYGRLWELRGRAVNHPSDDVWDPQHQKVEAEDVFAFRG